MPRQKQAALNADIKKQMQDNVANRRYQPISSVERSLNKDLLEKVGGAVLHFGRYCFCTRTAEGSPPRLPWKIEGKAPSWCG
eukprot:scaffold197785_cov18-Tisochrysis_lutea.AAC.1